MKSRFSGVCLGVNIWCLPLFVGVYLTHWSYDEHFSWTSGKLSSLWIYIVVELAIINLIYIVNLAKQIQTSVFA